MDNRRVVFLAVFLGFTSLMLVFLAFYAGSAELAAAPSFLVGFLTGLLTIATMALLYAVRDGEGAGRASSVTRERPGRGRAPLAGPPVPVSAWACTHPVSGP